MLEYNVQVFTENLLSEKVEVVTKQLDQPYLNKSHMIYPKYKKFIIIQGYHKYNISYNVQEANCSFQYEFEPRATYYMYITKNCDLPTVVESREKPYTTLYIYLAVLFFLHFAYILYQYYKKHCKNFKCIQQNVHDEKRSKIISLDAIRGLILTLMIFINYDGGMYCEFAYSVWNGLKIADFVLPSFIWIFGFTMVLSINKKLAFWSKKKLCLHIIARSVIMFLFGMMLTMQTNVYGWSDFPVTGVLQRIAFAYYLVALSEVLLASRNIEEEYEECCIREVMTAKIQFIIPILICIIYLAIIRFINAPDCPNDYLGPGGTHMNSIYQNCTGGIISYIDRIILGSHTTKNYIKAYDTIVPFDKNGPFSILMTSVNLFLGGIAGRIFISYKSTCQRVIKFCVYGLLYMFLGGMLCAFSRNNGLIPINHNLNSLSLVLICSGISFNLFIIIYIIIDKYRIWNGKPYTFIGINPFLFYILHILFKGTFPIRIEINDHPPNYHGRALIAANWSLLLFHLFAYYLYKKKLNVNI